MISIVGFACFVRVERRTASPILPPELIMHRGIGPALVGSGLLGVVFFGVDTYVPLYVQGTTGAGATAAAGVVTPVMLSWAASGFFIAPLVVRWGFRRTALIGSVLATISFVGLVICALVHASGWVLAAVLMVGGVGFGSASMPYLLSVQHMVTWRQRGLVTSAVQFFRTMGGAVGIGVLGMLFNLLAAPQMEQLRKSGISPSAIMDPHSQAKLSGATNAIIRDMIDSGLTWVFVAMALLSAAQFCVTLLMPKSDDAADAKIEPLEALHG
jgi:MFS family permease